MTTLVSNGKRLSLAKLSRRFRLRLVMWFARIFRVPIDIHGSFFVCMKKDSNSFG